MNRWKMIGRIFGVLLVCFCFPLRGDSSCGIPDDYKRGVEFLEYLKSASMKQVINEKVWNVEKILSFISTSGVDYVYGDGTDKKHFTYKDIRFQLNNRKGMFFDVLLDLSGQYAGPNDDSELSYVPDRVGVIIAVGHAYRLNFHFQKFVLQLDQIDNLLGEPD